jgi:hypothetical protein
MTDDAEVLGVDEDQIGELDFAFLDGTGRSEEVHHGHSQAGSVTSSHEKKVVGHDANV